MTSAPPPPLSEPDPSTFTCSTSQVGPCSGCHRHTHKYGHGGLPLCHWCMATAQANWGNTVRFTGARTPAV
ncbi:hypothetical protein AB0F07_40265 [Streptomyces fructofermentans]|uniref:hypothetical protein n=1 Tax=Streptomyces fructofermentans TaxID=152141 RepID=UPI0033FF8392